MKLDILKINIKTMNRPFKSKILLILKFLLSVKISFKSPKKSDLIVYDNTSIDLCEKTF